MFQLSTDTGNLERTYSNELLVVSDTKSSLKVLLPELRKATADRRRDYQHRFERTINKFKLSKESLLGQVQEQQSATIITPPAATFRVTRAIEPDVAIVNEAIAASGSLRKSLNNRRMDQYAFLRGGDLGWGIPAAVSYSFGLGKAPVVCFVGGGAAMYSLQALWTVAHEKLPVTFIVVNNAEYNVLRNFVHSQAGYTSAQTDRFIAMDLANPSMDYQALGASMRLETRKVIRASDITPAVEAALMNGKPDVIEITVNKS